MLADIAIQFAKTPFVQSMHPAQKVMHTTIVEKIAEAHRFVLNRDAVMMLHTVSESSPRRFVQALGVCRLPYPKMWVEFAYKDRHDWHEEAKKRGITIAAISDASPPSRLGFLIEQDDDDGRSMTVIPVWSHTGAEASVAYMALHLDARPEPPPQTEAEKATIRAMFNRDREAGVKDQMLFLRHLKDPQEMEAAVEMQARIDMVTPDYLKPIWTLAMAKGHEVVDKMMEMARFDLRSEWRFVLALLTTLNSRNLISFGPVEDYAKLNKVRTKQGKEPLVSHREIRLSLSKVQRARAAMYTGAGGAIRSASLVMGHWKVRKTGVFWWSPHARGGDGDAPAVRTYNVTG